MITKTPANRYGSIAAEIYDLDKPIGALPDTAFHLERLAAIDGPVLEPACGSGRTLIPLLEAGREVAGFDPSAEMLAQCAARSRTSAVSGSRTSTTTVRSRRFWFRLALSP